MDANPTGLPMGLLSIEDPAAVKKETDLQSKEQDDREKQLAKEVLAWHDGLKTHRKIWEPVWQEIRELILPNAEDFTKRVPRAYNRKERIFDDTPTWACNTLAAGLHSYMTNPAQRWFGLSSRDFRLDEDPDVALYFEICSNRIFDQFSDPATGFNTALPEFYRETSGFGTALLAILENQTTIGIRSIPMAECYISENEHGQVDTVSREFELTFRQAKMKFGDKLLKVPRLTENTEDLTKFIHLVYPVSLTGNFKYKSVYVHMESGTVVGEGAFEDLPYVCTRWSKMAGDVYGRCPGMDSLQNIRILNESVRILMQASQLQAAPPIIFENDGVLTKIVLEPWKNMMIAPGSQFPRPLDIKPNIPISMDFIKEVRNTINKNFFNDLFQNPDYGNRERVTTVEVQSDKDDRLRKLSSVTSRFESEALSPIIVRIFNFLDRNGKLPTKPAQLRGRNFFIEYQSPTARAQRSQKSENNMRFLQNVIPLSQQFPQLIDYINTDMMIKELALGMDVSRLAINTDEMVAQTRQARAQQQQQQVQGQQALDASTAVKNIAQAHQAAPDLSGQIMG